MYYFIEPNCYNTHDTELFPSTNVFTGIVLQHYYYMFYSSAEDIIMLIYCLCGLWYFGKY